MEQEIRGMYHCRCIKAFLASDDFCCLITFENPLGQDLD